jgi:acetyltransferase-like isoleucine patch superfamily enzyme
MKSFLKKWVLHFASKIVAWAAEHRQLEQNKKYSLNKSISLYNVAIGRQVHITSKTHDFSLPTSDETHIVHITIEKDTVVGNYVWIGDKVFIKEGITIGDYAIIGANSVVIEDVKPFEIVAGIPARHIRFNSAHYKYKGDNA